MGYFRARKFTEDWVWCCPGSFWPIGHHKHEFLTVARGVGTPIRITMLPMRLL